MTKIHNGSIINAALAEKVTYDAILLYQFWPERASIVDHNQSLWCHLRLVAGTKLKIIWHEQNVFIRHDIY